MGDILSRVGSFNRGPFFVAGTPKEVADAIEMWLDEGGIDGINLRQFLTPGTAEDFIELAVPELRRRGRYRESYEPGETLRERLFGAGHARLLPDHPAPATVTPLPWPRPHAPRTASPGKCRPSDGAPATVDRTEIRPPSRSTSTLSK